VNGERARHDNSLMGSWQVGLNRTTIILSKYSGFRVMLGKQR
jgi:hypothetical protein